ncbi:MAG: hypothetical protein HXY40_08535 [Chloroflexi bacterium]|nr:hypothetical protein [Chloroflexota bacterium]
MSAETFRPLAPDTAIFRCDLPAYSLFYAPGYLVVVPAAQAEAFARESAGCARTPLAQALVRRAQAALAAQRALYQQPYRPVCLTLYLNNRCHLACTYCFALPARPQADTPRLSLQAVQRAAEHVAENCRARALPFTLVLHGGGEPTLDWRLAEDILGTAAAAAAPLPLFRYIATNGVVSEQRAHWLAQRFDLIGLSCDGPPDIQAQQRPLANGQSSAPFVERTAQILRAQGTAFHVRVTLTAATLARQPEIAAYLCEQIQPQEIHVEPVYGLGRGQPLSEQHVDDFVNGFFAARALAQTYGIAWRTSGSRPQDIHGAYCNVWRDVLHLLPGAAVTACFAATNAQQAQNVALGSVLPDPQRVRALREQLRRAPAPCADCFNRFHCARGCPQYCPLDEQAAFPAARCQAQKALIFAHLQATAAALYARSPAIGGQEIAL